MITHEALFQACKTYGLDPTIVGGSKIMNSYPLSSYDKPIDLETIGFPEEERTQVIEIGNMIFNLKSQLVCHCYNLGTESGKAEHEKDSLIKSILPAMEEAIDFWLKSGLKKAKGWKDLVIHNGRVFEMNPGYYKSMDKFDKRMAEFHRECIRKLVNSEKEAEKVILR